jgi:hypothetical protein
MAQALLAQFAGQAGGGLAGSQQQGMLQAGGGGGSLAGGSNPADDPNSAARQQQLREDPDSYNAWLGQWNALHSGGGGADYSQYFGRPGQPSGNITDVGWMNAVMPWQGGVGVGGYPNATPSGGTPFIGGGSMAYADPNYWGYVPGGGGGNYNPANDPNSAARQQQLREDPASYNAWYSELQRQGGGMSGDAGYGGMSGGSGGGASIGGGVSGAVGGGPAVGSPGNPGVGAPGFSLSPVGHGFEAYSRGQQDYSYSPLNSLNDAFSQVGNPQQANLNDTFSSQFGSSLADRGMPATDALGNPLGSPNYGDYGAADSSYGGYGAAPY